MKVSMEVTMEGLLRALRWQAHNIAEEAGLDRAAAGGGSRRLEPRDRKQGERSR